MGFHDDPDNTMTHLGLAASLALLATLLVTAHANAYEAGWMQTSIAGSTPDAPPTTVALYYPTTSSAARHRDTDAPSSRPRRRARSAT